VTAPRQAPQATASSAAASGRQASTAASQASTAASQAARAEEVRGLIDAKLADIAGETDHYGILGLERDAADVAIRRVYFELAKKLHPDRLRAVGVTDSPAAAQRVFARINEAFGVLSSATRRAEYDRILAAGGERKVAEREREAEDLATRALSAEQHFLQGEMLGRRNKWDEAYADFARAVELSPEEAEYHALLAWAVWCRTPEASRGEVLSDVYRGFREATKLSAKCVPAFLYRGRVAQTVGDEELALECFRRVVSLDPSHQEANLNVRLIERRMSRRSEKRGLFSRLKGNGDD
jgi:tetratricopeptide (TPR) repeat protein